MEILNHKRAILDAMESNDKGSDNFATKSISTKYIEGKSSSFKKRRRSRLKI